MQIKVAISALRVDSGAFIVERRSFFYFFFIFY